MRRLTPVLVAMALISAACSGGDESPTATSSDSSADGETAAAAGSLPFLVPRYLPKGVAVRSGDIRRGRSEPDGWAATFGRPAGNGGFDGVIRANVSAADADREVPQEESAHLKFINVDGVRARVTDSEVVGIAIDWWVGGKSVVVHGSRGDRPSVIAVARAIKMAPSAAETTVTSPPADYVQITAAGFRGFGSASYTVDLRGAPTANALILASEVAPGSRLLTALMIGSKLRPVKVRGHAGYVGYDVDTPAALKGFKQASVAWMETPSLVVSVQGSLTESELLKIANGLRVVSEAAWRRQMPRLTP